jgi:tetratricopeptide (TPR) repeat protein
MKWIPALLFIVLALLSPSAAGASKTASIVPVADMISDDDARLALARILSYNDATLKDSLAEYTILVKQLPGNADVAVEAAGVLTRLKMFPEAVSVLGGIYQKYPRDSRIVTSLADLECGLGHARTCRDLYLKALDLPGVEPGLKLKFADRMNTWGDFYKAESIYRERLRDVPDDPDLLLKLAGTLAGSQRYEEAAEIYGKLMHAGPGNAPVLLGLAVTKLWEKDGASSERYSRAAMTADSTDTQAPLILAESYIIRGEYHKARSVYEEIAARRGASPDMLVNIGITYMKEGNAPEASRYFKKAAETGEESISAQFYAGWPDAVGSPEFAGTILGDGRWSAPDFAQWAALYSSQGDYARAVQFFDAALKKDPLYFPASIGRAEALGSDRQYDRSADSYRDLSRDFPEDSKIMTGHARVLSWARRYGESAELYKRIIALNPSDPVPRRELARTYMWAKEPARAMDAYDGAIAQFSGTKHRDITEKADEFSAGQRIQRSLTLERDAKRLAYEKRFARSLPVYETLIKENPGNEEALFDEAQVACALGLCSMEGKIYDRLLTLDPMHSLARESREWQRSRANPSTRLDYSYWNEEGRGDLARITRNRFDASVDVPVQCQYRVFLKAHRWLEQPDFDRQTYGATGFSLGFGGTFSPVLSGEFSWTHKRYDSASLGNKETGYGTLWYTANDRLKLGAGYARTDELYNYFGINQGVQADRYWIGFKSDITRKLEISGRGEYINYTDSNSGVFFGLTTGYALTDHPRIFKISAAGEYRNTRYDNEYIYTGSDLTNIIHPYWAPRDYFAASIIFEWQHDLAKLFVCGTGQHYYDIKVSFGTDTENNPYAKLEGEWNFEFVKHWLVGLKGMVHTSPEWNATGAWAFVRYRF